MNALGIFCVVVVVLMLTFDLWIGPAVRLAVWIYERLRK